jgi:hypothetical protein
MFGKNKKSSAPRKTAVERGIVVLAVLGAAHVIADTVGRIRNALPKQKGEQKS